MMLEKRQYCIEVWRCRRDTFSFDYDKRKICPSISIFDTWFYAYVQGTPIVGADALQDSDLSSFVRQTVFLRQHLQHILLPSTFTQAKRLLRWMGAHPGIESPLMTSNCVSFPLSQAFLYHVLLVLDFPCSSVNQDAALIHVCECSWECSCMHFVYYNAPRSTEYDARGRSCPSLHSIVHENVR